MADNTTAGVVSYGFAALAGLTTLSDQRSRNRDVAFKMKQEGEQSLYRLGMTENEIKALDLELARVLSQEDIKSLKDEAFAVAYQASSGLTGSADVQIEAAMTSAQAKADIVAKGKAQQANALRSMYAESFRYRQQADAIRQSIMSPESAAIGAFSNVLQGFNVGLGMLSSGQRTDFLQNVSKPSTT